VYTNFGGFREILVCSFISSLDGSRSVASMLLVSFYWLCSYVSCSYILLGLVVILELERDG
jgi:hypothetical protein